MRTRSSDKPILPRNLRQYHTHMNVLLQSGYGDARNLRGISEMIMLFLTAQPQACSSAALLLQNSCAIKSHCNSVGIQNFIQTPRQTCGSTIKARRCRLGSIFQRSTYVHACTQELSNSTCIGSRLICTRWILQVSIKNSTCRLGGLHAGKCT